MEQKVIELLADHFSLDTADITAETSFEELGIDSLDVVEFVMTLEDEFDVQIEAAQAGKTVGELVAYIESKQA